MNLKAEKRWLEEIGQYGYFYSPSILFEMRMEEELKRVKSFLADKEPDKERTKHEKC